ncbi:hypothetical protein [Streptomyces sp. SPB4]|uniref:hypothetical protein n=1 Tax=Streptomyces sp. SPB4 TaxID=2940553 RepID=UPI002475A15C|nr:hypothetical protein [Streptomyces sp. SPB4]MDH6544862.1 hypothetical protein [Streptomyces sp. SPB4]
MPTSSTASTEPDRGRRIREIFRTVVADRFADGSAPAHAELLFADVPFDSDGEFLGDFCNEILHQDTCNEQTHEGVPLLAVLAADDRVPPRERMSLVSLLFSIATVTERHEAECWPRTHPHADPAGEERSRASVQVALPQLLARWETECVTVRLALAAVAAAFPSAGASQDLLTGLRALAGQYPGWTLPGDYVRLAGTITVGNRENVLTAVEALTSQNWRPTARSAPLTGRALHLLDQMLGQLRATGKTQDP